MVYRIGDKEEKQSVRIYYPFVRYALLPKDSQAIRGKLYFLKREREGRIQ